MKKIELNVPDNVRGLSFTMFYENGHDGYGVEIYGSNINKDQNKINLTFDGNGWHKS